ncbi:hypothetical protein MAHJHV47_46660 [Mycobacterium avium subsp. hominissuis]
MPSTGMVRTCCLSRAICSQSAVPEYRCAADWEQIALLKQQVRTIPVLGNGDIYDASDALTTPSHPVAAIMVSASLAS